MILYGFFNAATGAWLNGDLQIWMRVYIPSETFFRFGYVWMTCRSAVVGATAAAIILGGGNVKYLLLLLGIL